MVTSEKVDHAASRVEGKKGNVDEKTFQMKGVDVLKQNDWKDMRETHATS